MAIASRIFNPEPSAASFRLQALAEALAERGDDVTVLTVQPPRQIVNAAAAGKNGSQHTLANVTGEIPTVVEPQKFRVRRFPVLRDRNGYVRGYVQYLSFDVPLFFRILFGKKRNLIIAEPPPTTGLFVRLAAAVRRTPYVYYAADIWSDAASQTGAPSWMLDVVRRIELFAWKGARLVLSVSDGVTMRLAELGVTENVATIGNGVNAREFVRGVAVGTAHAPAHPEFVYAGTASEWHGADVFVRALPRVLAERPDVVLRFIGGGSEREAIEALADDNGVSHAVRFEPVRGPAELAPVLHGAVAALASVRPGSGYDFAFPTKLYSAAVCGAPLIYAGTGPGQPFARTEVDGAPIGVAVGLEPGEVAEAMLAALQRPHDAARRSRVSSWAMHSVSLEGVAARAVAEISRL
ncbi:glycosyltransferase [Leucobacter aridicollis]|nr:glycosyltransferase [Leucobacter aridicollis]